MAPILGKVTGPSVSRTEGREAGWISRLDWVVFGIDWPAGLFAGVGRDERWARVKAAGLCTEKINGGGAGLIPG
jgi:hypothetical protein